MENQGTSIEEIVQSEGWKSLTKRMETISAMLLGVIVVMILAGYTENEHFSLILTITLTTLSILCFFMGFEKFDSESKVLSYLFYKIYGFGLATGFITLLFIKQKWPYPTEMFAVLSIILIVISLYLGYKEKTSENKNNIDWKYFLRIFVVLIPLVYILVTNYK